MNRYCFLLPQKQNLMLTIERTNRKFGSFDINIFMPGVACQGVAFPLLFSMLPKRGNSNCAERITLTERFIALSGSDCIEAIMADREFAGEDWYFAYSQMGTLTKLYWDAVKNIYATSPNVAGEQLLYAYMGTANGNFAFIFNSSGYNGSLYYNTTLVGDDKITLQFAMAGGGDGVWYHNNAGFYYLLYPLGYSSPVTFTLTTDSPKSPSWIKLTDDADPDNWMLLSAATVGYPFDN
jgi:hypothetical protein